MAMTMATLSASTKNTTIVMETMVGVTTDVGGLSSGLHWLWGFGYVFDSA